MRVHSILLPLLAVTSPAFVSAKSKFLSRSCVDGKNPSHSLLLYREQPSRCLMATCPPRNSKAHGGITTSATVTAMMTRSNRTLLSPHVHDEDEVLEFVLTLYFSFAHSNSRQNSNELPEHPPELVPKGVIFLDFIYDFVTCSPVERTGTVPVDTKLVFIPIGVSSWYDLDDDVNSTVQDPGCAGRGGPELEASIDEDLSIFRNLTNYSQEPFANVNENALEPFFLLWEEEFYYSACPNDPGKELCDECDVNFQPPEGCQPVAGVDVYPMYGWWAADETEWTCGETRVYNFGGVLGEGDNAVCVNTTYTLSAYDETCPPPSSDANTVMYNGIFSLFCWFFLL